MNTGVSWRNLRRLLPSFDYWIFAASLLFGVAVVGGLHLSGFFDDTAIGLAHRGNVPVDLPIMLLMVLATASACRIFTGELFEMLFRAQASERAVIESNRALDLRVAERTAELEAAFHKLETANSELETFATSMSHDLRTPIRHISGYASILLDDLDDALQSEQRELLQKIEQSAVRLGRLGDGLLEFSRLNTKRLDLQKVHVNALVEDVIAQLDQQHRDQQIEWAVASLPDCRWRRPAASEALASLIVTVGITVCES